jgi:phage-related protein
MNKKWKVIYYKSKDGSIPVKKFINSRNEGNKLKFATLIDYLQEVGINLPRPYADYIVNEIYELRVKLSGDETRTLYFFCYENFIVLTNIFQKTTDKIPKKEINIAIKYKEDFLKRYNNNNILEAL